MRQFPLSWQRRYDHCNFGVEPRAYLVGEQVDSLLKKVDEHWRFVKDAEDIRGVLQNLRRCNFFQRLLPKGLMLRFVIATDEEDGLLWVLPDAAGVYPGRGMHIIPTRAALAQLVQPGVFQKAFKMKNRMHFPHGIEGHVDGQLLRHTQQLLSEACSRAESMRVVEEDELSLVLKADAKKEAERSCIKEQAGTNFSLEKLDAAVSHCIVAHIRQVTEIDTTKVNRTRWIIRPQPNTGDASATLYTTAKMGTLSYRELQMPSGGDRAIPRVLQCLSKQEICQALQIVDKQSTSLPTNSIVQQVVAADKPILIVDGVFNLASYRLQSAQLRLEIFRQSMLRAGMAPIDVFVNNKGGKANQKNM